MVCRFLSRFVVRLILGLFPLLPAVSLQYPATSIRFVFDSKLLKYRTQWNKGILVISILGNKLDLRLFNLLFLSHFSYLLVNAFLHFFLIFIFSRLFTLIWLVFLLISRLLLYWQFKGCRISNMRSWAFLVLVNMRGFAPVLSSRCIELVHSCPRGLLALIICTCWACISIAIRLVQECVPVSLSMKMSSLYSVDWSFILLSSNEFQVQQQIAETIYGCL
jgi:hypothetical protein